MRSGDVPCSGCQDRYLGCHDYCERYKEFKQKGQQEKEAKEKYYSGIGSYLLESRLRLAHKKNR